MIWLNGSFEDTSKISYSDRGFLLGDGVFETLYATGKTDVAVVFFNQHWQRLTTALNLVEIDIPYAANDILAACQHLIKHMLFENNNDHSQSLCCGSPSVAEMADAVFPSARMRNQTGC